MVRPSSTSLTSAHFITGSSAPSTANHHPYQQHHQQQLHHHQQQQQQRFRSKLLHATALLALAGSPSPCPDDASQSHPSPALSQQHSLPLHSPVGSDCYSEGSRGSCKSTGSSGQRSDSNDCSYQSSDGRTDGEVMSVSSAGEYRIHHIETHFFSHHHNFSNHPPPHSNTNPDPIQPPMIRSFSSM